MASQAHPAHTTTTRAQRALVIANPAILVRPFAVKVLHKRLQDSTARVRAILTPPVSANRASTVLAVQTRQLSIKFQKAIFRFKGPVLRPSTASTL